MEPILSSSDKLYGVLQAMPDSAGVKGDVRDVDFIIYKDEEQKDIVRDIGISCKNNHEAVKHPRITEDPDFAKTWTAGKFSCGEEFIKGMEKIFEKNRCICAAVYKMVGSRRKNGYDLLSNCTIICR